MELAIATNTIALIDSQRKVINRNTIFHLLATAIEMGKVYFFKTNRNTQAQDHIYRHVGMESGLQYIFN
jgi:hypothetical protein